MTAGRSPVVAAAKNAEATVIDKGLVEGLEQMLRLTEVGVVHLPLPGEQPVHGVMEVIVPHGAETVSTERGPVDESDVVEVALGDDVHGATELPGLLVRH